MLVEVKQGDVTTADADVLVNASNTNVWLGSGVSGAIRRACGPNYQETISAALGAPNMPPGEVLLTHAGTHPRARWVAHVAVMDYRPGHERAAAPTEDRIRVCSENLWRALESLDAPQVSVAMVALGAGTGGLGVRIPTELACSTLRAHLSSRPGTKIGRIIFYGWELHEFANIVHVVRKHFAIDESQLDPALLQYVQSLG